MDSKGSKNSSPFSSASSDDHMDDQLHSSSESDDERYDALKQAQAAQRNTPQARQEPKTCTIIRLPKPKPDEILTDEEKQYIAENVSKLD